MSTPFTSVYDRFLGKITDDMYVELTPQDTERELHSILLDAIPGFEFPRKNLYNYCPNNEAFVENLTEEEINILAVLMMNNWLQRQITSIENTRMKYSGVDFKITSQANFLAKLIALKTETERQDRHLQRLYKRRRLDKNNKYESNWDIFKTKSAGIEIKDFSNLKIDVDEDDQSIIVDF